MNLTNLFRTVTVIGCFALSCACFSAIAHILLPRINVGELAIVSMLYLSIWIFAEVGVFAISIMRQEHIRAEIQKDLDVERSFRKLSKKWEQSE